MRIKVFSIERKDEWDHFVAEAKNGTFLFYRNFMDYHSYRFEDQSLFFYKKDKLIALLPGNIEDNTFYSHQGLTYGGLIMHPSIKSSDVLNIFDSLIDFLQEKGIKEIIYKAIPHIYHSMPAEEDLYALFRHQAELIERNISSSIYLRNKSGFSTLRKRGVRKAQKANLKVVNDDNFEGFWEVLSQNLEERYHVSPVHSVDEIKLLYSKFPKNIKLYNAYDQSENVVGGVVAFYTQTVVHLQYIATNDYGKENGALDLIIDTILKNGLNEEKVYFDFGTSNENNGLYLNSGLIHQKEGFGGRGIVYDIYKISLK